MASDYPSVIVTGADAKLFIIRHGESEWNRAGLVQGQSPAAPGLTKAGMEHAVAAAGQLAGSSATLIVSSDLRRTRETAALLSSILQLPVQSEPLLRERDYGVIEGTPSADADALETGIVGEIVTDVDAFPPGGESLRMLYGRIAAFLVGLPLRVPDRRVILVTHGGPIRVAMAYLAGVEVEDMKWPAVPNGSILEAVLGDFPPGSESR